VLIAPRTKAKGGADINPIKTPLTGLLTLATIVDEENYDVKFYDELLNRPDYEELDPDFLLLSCMSATAKRGYEIADRFREKDTTVVMGGLHPSFRPKESLKHCDKVVKGEGDKVILDILEGKYEKNLIRADPVMDLDSIPLPDYGLIEGVIEQPDKVSISASRGCPYSCKFCSLTKMFGTNIRTISNEKVIDYLKKIKAPKTLCFDEPNFRADKERARNLVKSMKEYGISPKRTWISVSLEVAQDEEFLKQCSEASDFNFTIGLESINKKVQKSYSLGKRYSVTRMKEYIDKIRDHGIKIEGSFIFGSNHDDKDVFQNTLEFCKETEIEFPAFFPLTPYPGTELRTELSEQDRIFTDNWNLYDNLHTVFYPKNMSPYELQKGIIDCYEEYYSISKGIKHVIRGQFFYCGATFYLKYLFYRIKRENKEYLRRLEKV